jgi:hypothetical protein
MARLPDDEIQRRYEEALSKVDIDQDEAERRWPNCDPDDRERRRKLAMIAAAKHATIVDDETGQKLLGGHQPRKNKTDVMQTIADLADGERQKEVIDALFAPLSDESKAVRGKGAERIIKIKAEHVERERRDREELRQLDRGELIDRLAKGILSGGMGAELAKALSSGVSAKVSPNGTPYDVDGNVEVSDSATDVDFKAA